MVVNTKRLRNRLWPDYTGFDSQSSPLQKDFKMVYKIQFQAGVKSTENKDTPAIYGTYIYQIEAGDIDHAKDKAFLRFKSSMKHGSKPIDFKVNEVWLKVF